MPYNPRGRQRLLDLQPRRKGADVGATVTVDPFGPGRGPNPGRAMAEDVFSGKVRPRPRLDVGAPEFVMDPIIIPIPAQDAGAPKEGPFGKAQDRPINPRMFEEVQYQEPTEVQDLGVLGRAKDPGIMQRIQKLLYKIAGYDY